jgi:hypothetical protein
MKNIIVIFAVLFVTAFAGVAMAQGGELQFNTTSPLYIAYLVFLFSVVYHVTTMSSQKNHGSNHAVAATCIAICLAGILAFSNGSRVLVGSTTVATYLCALLLGLSIKRHRSRRRS